MIAKEVMKGIVKEGVEVQAEEVIEVHAKETIEMKAMELTCENQPPLRTLSPRIPPRTCQRIS